MMEERKVTDEEEFITSLIYYTFFLNRWLY